MLLPYDLAENGYKGTFYKTGLKKFDPSKTLDTGGGEGGGVWHSVLIKTL